MCTAGLVFCLCGGLLIAAHQLLANASPYRALWCGAGCPSQGKGMIEALAIALGLSAQDPFFWMPLVFMLLFFAIIVAGTVLDGFDIGVGCLTLFAPKESRQRMLSLLYPWGVAHEFWLFLALGPFVAFFPQEGD